MDILEKNLLILASAGSGKTHQLGNRVIGLVARGTDPEKIVALTFTRKAAGEFADSVLGKLAKAVRDGDTADELRDAIGNPHADFAEALERMVKALPKFTLGTMDSFFSKVVRGFQYELGLTGGKFELLEGMRAEAARDEILSEILAEPVGEGAADEFLHAFRRATIGKEEAGVSRNLREFISTWQGRYRADSRRTWGPPGLAGARVEDWDAAKADLAAKARRGLDLLEYTDKRQRPALEKAIDVFELHTVGSGMLAKGGALLDSIRAAVAAEESPMRVRSYKEFIIGGTTADALRELVLLSAHCEMAAAIGRTRAIRDAVAEFDIRCETRLRKRGLLGFEDVKILMGRWTGDEDARVRRELVDFRLDARYNHWLLDEFQDTSRADWIGLGTLVDEAAASGGDDRTMFIVGDRKQAIYAWRGGEVGLFDEVMRRYEGERLKVETMEESWRSCPEVLELVNRVCGDRETIGSLFGEAALLWEWKDHHSAAPLRGPGKRGHASVEICGDWEERKARTVEILRELGVGARAMSCGILVRGNSEVRELSEELRAAGFDVIEEGRRQPAADNPVGIALAHLLQWLANPADAFAREVIRMSPLETVIKPTPDTADQAVWEDLLARASARGFAPMMEEIVEGCWNALSPFGRRRAGDLIAALAQFDAGGGKSAREAAAWIGGMEVSQSPGVAAVQVMTIHKSKGLGFDVVILPEIPSKVIPESQYFTVADGADWICQPPASWARRLLPPVHEAEVRWATDQKYQAMCMLYVALTRAKRGLHVLLEPPSPTAAEDKASLSNWITTSLQPDGGTDAIFSSGSSSWVEDLPALAAKPPADTTAMLGDAVPRRERISPSSMKAAGFPGASAGGRRAGSEIHRVLESVGWVDEDPPVLPAGDAGRRIASLLAAPALHPYFHRDGRHVQLHREQPVEAIVDGRWLSGAIDRLLVHRDALGLVARVEILDFKTDAVEGPDELKARHSAQMEAYRGILRAAYPGAMVECVIISTALRKAVVV